ncbi:MAG: DUF397 domain-containing protein [Stackebrandtia sp.]
MIVQGPWRKSSRSGQTGGSTCVEARMAGEWRKSSRSGAQSGSACVEARMSGRVLQVRDSKLGDASPILDLGEADFTGLLRLTARR